MYGVRDIEAVAALTPVFQNSACTIYAVGRPDASAGR
jgi:hypothetical protein